jgi:hypothetical protein
MIHLLPGSADERFASELREAGVLTPDVMERIDASLGRPEHCLLDDFLLSGADFINSNEWISWLIRRHGCHRFGRVAWPEDASDWIRESAPVDGNLPYRRCVDGRILVAVLRPDRLPAASERWKASRPLWAAATLGEIRDLKKSWDGVQDEMRRDCV